VFLINDNFFNLTNPARRIAKRLTGFLCWTILIDVPIMKGPRAGAARSKAFKACSGG